jgi:hypothetical protein
MKSKTMIAAVERKWGKQPKRTWKLRAHTLASETVDDLQEHLSEHALNTYQKTMVFAMIKASIIAAFNAVAVEAVKGEDVSGAL